MLNISDMFFNAFYCACSLGTVPRVVLFNSFSAIITAYSGVIVGWVRYLCLKNTVSLTLSDNVLDIYSRKHR